MSGEDDLRAGDYRVNVVWKVRFHFIDTKQGTKHPRTLCAWKSTNDVELRSRKLGHSTASVAHFLYGLPGENHASHMATLCKPCLLALAKRLNGDQAYARSLNE